MYHNEFLEGTINQWRICILYFLFRYILYYSPAVYKIDGKEFESLDEYRNYFKSTLASKTVTIDDTDPYYGGIKVPANDYGSGKTSIILVLIAFFVDSLAMAGIYIQYKGTLRKYK